jgi:hypothetical protein
VYVWIWRHLPGGLPGRLLGSLVLLAVAVLLLFTIVFPRLEPLLPFSDVTVDAPAIPGPSTSSSPTPSP